MLQQNLEDAYQESYVKPSVGDDEPTTSKSVISKTDQLDKSMRRLRVSKTEGRLEGPSEALLYR